MLPFSDTYRPSRNYTPIVSNAARRREVVFSAYLSDILVSHFADLLDVCRALGNTLQRVAADDQLVLLRLGDLDFDTGLHHHSLDDLLADEVPVVYQSALLPSCLGLWPTGGERVLPYRISTS
jgi:hypothetical protein